MSEIQRLQDRIAELETMLGLTEKLPLDLLPPKFKAMRCVQPIIGVLMTRSFASSDALYFMLFGDRAEREQPEPQYIRVLIRLARKCLAPHGVVIKTAWGEGYYIDAENKAKLNRLLASLNWPQILQDKKRGAV